MESTNVYFDLSILDASSTSAPGLMDPNDSFPSDVAYFPDVDPTFSPIPFPHHSDPMCFPTNVAYFPDAYPPIPFPHHSDSLWFPTDVAYFPLNDGIDAYPAIAPQSIPESVFPELDLLSINEPEVPQLPVHVNNPLPVQGISMDNVQPVTPHGQQPVISPTAETPVRQKQKRRNAEQRKRNLRNDEFIVEVQETWVLCGGCKKIIKLDERDGAQYYPGLWFAHKARCRGIPYEIRRQEKERPKLRRRSRKSHHPKDPFDCSGVSGENFS